MPGIYKTATGFRAVASIGRGPDKRVEKRFPKGTAPRVMARWQETARAGLRLKPTVAAGSLGDDLERHYLPAVKGMPTFTERERHLRLWVAELGARRSRDLVTAPEVRAVLERWRLAHDWEAGTANRHRTALMHFYTVLNGKGGANPVRDVPKYRERGRPLDEAFDYRAFEAILAAMPDQGQGLKGQTRREISQTKARLRVIAYTGLEHIKIMALTPAHLRLDSQPPMVYVIGRDKGDGTDDVWLPLARAGAAALAAFAAAGAWGPFSHSSVYKSFKRAARKVGWPAITPYQLRHLFGTQLLRSSKNRSATRDLMRHTSEHTTNRYVAGAISVELRAAIAAYDRDVVANGCGRAAGEETETPGSR